MYFIKHKKYTRNPKESVKESDRCPEAAAGQNQQTVSCLQDRLRAGGPKAGDSPFQQNSTTPSTTPIYKSEIQLLPLPPITMEDPPTTTTTTTTTTVTEVVFAFRAKNFEKYRFNNQ
jgi:hypothetical protein